MKSVRKFRASTLDKTKSKVARRGRFEVEVNGEVVAKTKNESDAKYVRNTIRRFFRRVLRNAPRIAIKKSA